MDISLPATTNDSVLDLAELPQPSPDLEFHERVLEDGFKRYPLRRQNYERYLAARRGEIVDYMPIKLDVENVSRCNFHCTMCPVSDWPKFTRAEDLHYDDFTRVIDEQYGVIELKLQGIGEPLLGKTYTDMIAYARSKQIWVRSTSNASLLHLNDAYRRVIDSDICELQISIDGATDDTYESIRRGGKLGRVKENCSMLNGYCQQVGHKRTRMWVVVQSGNLQELEMLVTLAVELGFSRLTFSLDLWEWRGDWHGAYVDSNVSNGLDVRRANQLVQQGRGSGVEVTFWRIEEKYSSDNICPWPWERAYISSDMRIVPCCIIGQPSVADLGDARNFTTEWNSEPYRRFRKAHLEGQIPDICKGCYECRDKSGPCD